MNVNLFEIALIALFTLGIFFIWLGGANIFRSKRQLRKSKDYTIIRRKFDERLQQLFDQEESSFIKLQWRKWNTWSEIGKGQAISLFTLLLQSMILGFLSVALSWLFTSSFWVMMMGGTIGIVLPFLLLKAQYLRVTYQARRFGLLPYIDLYKNSYIAANQNVITAFHVSERDCPKEMQPVLDWLLRRLHDGSPQKDGLREFAVILHSEWAEVFVNYCISGLEGEAENIVRSLSQLQIEMHGMRDEEEEREMITRAAFFANFVIIGLTLVGIFFISLLLPQIKRFFVEQNEGHVMLTFALWTWVATIIYSYFRLKGGDN
ncbi:hypothetical protein [Brevibacillus formosus]|uniref:hypothetical protein n=1 Tax=Brevibacillus formosus TaxID=54913 RepID=UPI003F1CB388